MNRQTGTVEPNHQNQNRNRNRTVKNFAYAVRFRFKVSLNRNRRFLNRGYVNACCIVETLFTH